MKGAMGSIWEISRIGEEWMMALERKENGRLRLPLKTFLA